MKLTYNILLSIAIYRLSIKLDDFMHDVFSYIRK